MPSEPSVTFGELLQRFRGAAGLTQEELAERAGLSPRGISDLERGLRRAPYATTTLRLVTALELSELQRDELLRAGARRSRARGVAERASGPWTAWPRATERRPGHNLPYLLSSFVGRGQEVAQIRHQLTTTRLLTLIGPGGVGKTRLALRTAESMLDCYPDGVWLIELDTLADGGLLPQTVGRVLGVHELPGVPLINTLAVALKDCHLLLILDTCEHLLPACSTLAAGLLGGCPELSIMATSREVFGVTGETVWRVPPLSLPDAQEPTSLDQIVATSEAAALFVERAEAASPGFAPGSGSGVALAEVCRRLDGIPLAIELAAARLRLFGLDQLAARVDDRLRLLSTGDRAAPARQLTLRATIDWSYGLLSEPERKVFEILSVFVGNLSLEAVEAVGGAEGDESDVVDVLGRLIDKSLVVAEPMAGQGPRYRLLEALRQYGEERLAERGTVRAIRQRHAAFFLRLLEQAERKITGASDETFLEGLEREHDNLRAALRWALAEGEVETALRLAGAAEPFWYLRGFHAEARGWYTQVLDLDSRSRSEEVQVRGALRTVAEDGTSRLAARAKVLRGLGVLATMRGDSPTARRAYTESLQLCEELDDHSGAAWALGMLGGDAVGRGDYADAHRLIKRAMAEGKVAGDPVVVALSLACDTCPGYPGVAWPGADIVQQGCALPDLIRTAEEAVQASRAIGFRAGVCWSLLALGGLRNLQHENAAARTHWEEALSIAREGGLKALMPPALTLIGRLAIWEGDRGRAAASLAEGLQLTRGLGDLVILLNALEAVAVLASVADQPEGALRIAARVDALRTATGMPLSPGDRAHLEASLEVSRRKLGGRAADGVWQEARGISTDSIILVALDLLDAIAHQ